jgi:hypothetical protein
LAFNSSCSIATAIKRVMWICTTVYGSPIYFLIYNVHFNRSNAQKSLRKFPRIHPSLTYIYTTLHPSFISHFLFIFPISLYRFFILFFLNLFIYSFFLIFCSNFELKLFFFKFCVQILNSNYFSILNFIFKLWSNLKLKLFLCSKFFVQIIFDSKFFVQISF